MDTTYIPMYRGFISLSAAPNWATRRVLAWHLSNVHDQSKSGTPARLSASYDPWDRNQSPLNSPVSC